MKINRVIFSTLELHILRSGLVNKKKHHAYYDYLTENYRHYENRCF